MIKFPTLRTYLTVCLIGLSLIASGCGEEQAPPPVVKKSPAMKKKVAPAPETTGEKVEKKKPGFAYDPSGKRDPFLPYLSSLIIGEGVEKEKEEVLTELQKYELSQLKLVAVMDLGGKGVAQVETPDGVGHTVYVGTLIGKHKGKVVEIKNGKVSVEEKFRDIMGDIKSTINELVIDHPEGGMVL